MHVEAVKRSVPTGQWCGGTGGERGRHGPVEGRLEEHLRAVKRRSDAGRTNAEDNSDRAAIRLLMARSRLPMLGCETPATL